MTKLSGTKKVIRRTMIKGETILTTIKHTGLQQEKFIIDGLTIESRFAGIKPAPFSDNKYHTADNHYRISLRYEGKSASFDFWTSYAKSNITTIEDLQGALECIISDALSGSNFGFMSEIEGIEEIMNEYGYKDIKEASRVFNDLKKSYIEMMKIFGSSTNDKLNEIWEILTQ